MSSSAEKKTGRGSLYALLAGITWGSSGTLASLLPDNFSSLTIGAFRLLTAGIFLLAFSGKNVGKLFRLRRGEGKTLLLSVASIALTQITFFTAVLKAGVGLSTMIFIGLSPLFAGVVEHFVDGTALDRRWYRSVGLTLAGAVLLGGINWKNLVEPSGIFFALAASIGWSLTGLTMKRLQRSRSSLEVTTLIMFLGGLALSPLLAEADWHLVASWPVPPILLALGFLSAALPYTLFSWAVRSIPAGHAFVLGMTEPLTAAVLGVFLLGEPFTPLHGIGYILILAGVLLLYLSREGLEERRSRSRRSRDGSR